MSRGRSMGQGAGAPIRAGVVAAALLIAAALSGGPDPARSQAAAPVPPPAEARPTQPKARQDASAIVQLLIARSIAAYPGPCACPYQSARNGSSCGKRAAYLRPGGYAPLCYVGDVTPEMIAAYRAGP